MIRFDGLSGNQVLLFQALDAFLGLEEYLTQEMLEQTVPSRQRDFCDVLRKYSFRHMLKEADNDEGMAKIAEEFNQILQRLRVFHISAL